MKKLTNILLAFTMLFIINFNAQAAQNDIKILIDEQYLVMDVQPIIVNNRTLVPIRAVVEKLGGEVAWDGEKSLVTVTKDNALILLTLNANSAILNGNSVELDVPAQIIESRTMIPLRFVAEALGVKVDFYKNTVIILTDTDADISDSKLVIDGKPTSKITDKKIEQIVDGKFIVTSPIGRNETATVVFKGEPNTEYSIEVHYLTTISKANGLENKKSDANGNVSWSWKIGGMTNPGIFTIYVKDGDNSYATTITVQYSE